MPIPLTMTARLDRVLRSAARLIGGVPKINMPLSRVICVTHSDITLASHSAAHLLQSCCADMALSYRLCPSLLAGTLSPCVDPGWASSASFLFWWQTLSPPCKHLDYTASCIHSCCSFYLEFTSLADSVVTKELHIFALQAA